MSKYPVLASLLCITLLCGCDKKPAEAPQQDAIYTMPIDSSIELPKAIHGDAKAQFRLGLCYLKGDTCPRDYHAAKMWFSKAAEQGLASAQLEIGYLYDKGLGVSKNIESAKAWFEKAAEKGNAQGQLEAAKALISEHVTLENLEKAKVWLQKAAEQGLPEAQKLLASTQLTKFLKQDAQSQPSASVTSAASN